LFLAGEKISTDTCQILAKISRDNSTYLLVFCIPFNSVLQMKKFTTIMMKILAEINMKRVNRTMYLFSFSTQGIIKKKTLVTSLETSASS